MGFLDELRARRQGIEQEDVGPDRVSAILKAAMMIPTGGVDPREAFAKVPRAVMRIGEGVRAVGEFPSKLMFGEDEFQKIKEAQGPERMKADIATAAIPPPETGLEQLIDIVGPAVAPTLAALPLGGGAKIASRPGRMAFDAIVEGGLGYAVAPEGKGAQTAAVSAVLGPALGQLARAGGKGLPSFQRQFTQTGRAAAAPGKQAIARAEILKAVEEGFGKAAPKALPAPKLEPHLPSLIKRGYEQRAFKAASREADKALRSLWEAGGEALPEGAEARAAQRAVQDNMIRSLPLETRISLGRSWGSLADISEKRATDIAPWQREELRRWANQQTEMAKDYGLRTQGQRDEVFRTLTGAIEETGQSKLIKTTELDSARHVLSRLDGPTVAVVRESLEGMTPSGQARVLNILNGVLCASPCVPIAELLQRPGRTARLVREIRMSGMLSGIGTWMRNTIGTSSRISVNPLRTIAAGGIDWAFRSKTFGMDRIRYAGEVVGELQGLWHGTKAAIKRKQFQIETPQDLVDFGLRTRAIREFGSRPPSAVGEALGGKMGTVAGRDVGTTVGKITQAPFNALNWQDEFMFTSVYSGELYRGAYRQAAKEGVPGVMKKLDRVQEIIAQQAHSMKDLHRQAITSAEIQVAKRAEQIALGKAKNPLSLEHLAITEWKKLVDEVQPDVGRSRTMAEQAIFIAREGRRMDQMIDSLDTWDEKLHGLVSIPLPFRRTPANVMRETIRSSPAGLVAPAVDIVKGGKASLSGPQAGEMMDRLGQATAGTAMLYTIWTLLQSDLISAEPFGREKGRADRLTKELAGTSQDSVRIGSWSMPIERIEPIGTMILSAARAKELQQAGKLEDAGAVLENLGWGLFEQAKNGAFLDSFAQFIDAASGDDRPAKKFAQRLGASFVPAAARDIRRALGASLEEVEPTEQALGPRTIAKEIGKGFLGQLGIGARAKLGTFGKERKPGQLFTGIRGEGNPIAQELVKIGAPLDIPKLPTGFKAEDIPRDERDIFIKAKGQMQEYMIKRVMSGPRYANLSDEVKKKVIQSVVGKVNRRINAMATAIKRDGRKWTTRDLLRGFIQTGG